MRKLLCAASCIVICLLCYLFTGENSMFLFSRKDFTKNDNCKIRLRKNIYMQVTDRRLDNLLHSCKSFSFNMSFLKKTIANFNCPHLTKHLDSQKPIVALASFPGSGSTMTWNLLELVTGIKTIRKRGQCWTPVLVVKSHAHTHLVPSRSCKELEGLKYEKAVYIIRNPFHAILAEMHRLRGSSPTKIGRLPRNFSSEPDWKKIVEQMSTRWKVMTIFWLRNFTGPVHLVIYEHMVKAKMEDMYHLIQFLGLKTTFKSLYCVHDSFIENLKRSKPKWTKQMTLLEIYKSDIRKIVNMNILSVLKVIDLKVLNRYILTDK